MSLGAVLIRVQLPPASRRYQLPWVVLRAVMATPRLVLVVSISLTPAISVEISVPSLEAVGVALSSLEAKESTVSARRGASLAPVVVSVTSAETALPLESVTSM